MRAACVTEVAFPFNLHLFRVILQSLLTGDVIAVFSTSFSISLACPLLFDSNSSVDWLTTHQDPFTPAHTTSKLPVLHQHQSPSPACSQPSVMFCCFELQFSSPPATTPNGLYTLDQPHSSNLIPPLLPHSSTWGYMITHFGGKCLSPDHCEHLLHQNSAVAKLLSRRVCHANVALVPATPCLTYCDENMCSLFWLLDCFWG